MPPRHNRPPSAARGPRCRRRYADLSSLHGPVVPSDPHRGARVNLPRLLLRLILGHRLPRAAGKLTVPGVRDKLVIHRDRWGIPYVEANNDEDAWFGLGFCHGQDRAFQLEILLRIVRGTLAELVGIAALRVDRLSRW